MGEGIISETACARDKSGGPLPLVMGTVSHRTLSETIANQMPATRRSPIRSVIPAKPVPDLPVPLQDGRVLSGSGNPEKPKNFRDAARVQACVASRTWGRSSVTRTPPGRRAESNVPSAVGAGCCPTCMRGAASRQDRCRYPVCPAVSSVWPCVGKTWIPDKNVGNDRGGLRTLGMTAGPLWPLCYSRRSLSVMPAGPPSVMPAGC